MYLATEQLNAVLAFVDARWAEQSRALVEDLGEDHPALALGRALQAAVRAAGTAVAEAQRLPEDAQTLGRADTGWNTLVAVAREWRGHPDYPAVADLDFHDVLHASLRAVVEQARPAVRHAFTLTSERGDLRLEYTNSGELERALRHGLEASATVCGLAACCTAVNVTAPVLEGADGFEHVPSAEISACCVDPRCMAQQAGSVVAAS